MIDENKRFIIKIVIFTLLLYAFLFILIFDIRAEAKEIVRPTTTLTKNGITYYGYDLPTRPTYYDGSSSGSVHFNITSYYNSNATNEYGFTELLYKRNLGDEIMGLLAENNNNNFDLTSITDIWTNDINLLSRYVSINVSRQTYYSYGYRVGVAVNDLQQVFENGYYIDYNATYSYDYDVILYNNGNNVGNYLDDSLYACQVSTLDSSQSTCVVNSTITVDKIIDSQKIKYYRYHVNFNNTSWSFGFNHSMVDDSQQLNQFKIFGNNFMGSDLNLGISSNKFVFSQPFNIKVWSTDSVYYCDENCWTQEDTDDNQRIDNVENYVFENINNIVDNFDYFGFGGIIQYMFDFIKSLLESTNDSCIALNIPILNSGIQLPSSCTFWGRDDVRTYESFYHMFILGLFSLFIGYRVYNDILNVYNPDSKIDDEVSKL